MMITHLFKLFCSFLSLNDPHPLVITFSFTPPRNGRELYKCHRKISFLHFSPNELSSIVTFRSWNVEYYARWALVRIHLLKLLEVY